MEDIGIKSEQFEKIFGGKGKRESNQDVHPFLFEQVWAADDYVIFKRMMIQKNIDLQLQALELLKHRYAKKADKQYCKFMIFYCTIYGYVSNLKSFHTRYGV